jgi:hypothetical protein
MSLTDLLKTLVTLLVGIVPDGFLSSIIGGLLDDVENLVAKNAIENILITPIVELIRKSLKLPAFIPNTTAAGNVVNPNPNFTFPIPLAPANSYVPGDLGNRANFVSQQLALQNIDISKVDVNKVNTLLFTATGWQILVLNYLATIR